MIIFSKFKLFVIPSSESEPKKSPLAIEFVIKLALKYVEEFFKKSEDSLRSGMNKKKTIQTSAIAIQRYIKMTEKILGIPLRVSHRVPGSTAEATTIDISRTKTRSFRTKSATKNNPTTIVLVIVPILILIVFSFNS